MVNIFREKDKGKFFKRLESRKNLASGEIAVAACEIVDAVRREGERARVRLTEKFDKVRLTTKRLRVTPEELGAATKKVEPSLVKDM
jgi:histidinol dehydrogenase